MSVAWYVKRLGAMSPREVLHRVDEQVKRSVSRRRPYGWDAFPPAGPVLPVPGLADTLRAGMTGPLEAALRRSVDALLEGRFSAHGIAWPKRDPADLFPADLWRLDPVTGLHWPGQDAYCFDLAYRHERQLGDIKFVWDLNRLQFLQPLAAGVALWGDARAASAIGQAVTSWAAANPPFRGLAWNSGIELALRAVTLALVAGLCGDRLEPGVGARIGQILAAHLYWLHRYPSRFSSANNHLIAEAMGEFVIAAVLPSAPRARAIEAQARAVLEEEAALQILPDGVAAEQSPTYGGFTVEMLLVADVVARAFGRPLGPIVKERAAAFADLIGTLGTAEGRVPNIGDDDEGRVLSLGGAREHCYPASIARAVAGHFGLRPRLARSVDAPELRDAFFPAALPEEPCPDGLRSFGTGGYTAIRETRAARRLHLVMDHGPLGYLSIAAHGHADANAIAMSLDDRPVLVDPGTYLYHAGGAWRDWFRGTGAHNTVRLGGLDQSVIAGAFNWSHKARAVLEGVTEGPDWAVAARHDGYLKRFGVEHHRRVAATTSGLAIEDRLVGPGAGAVTAEVVFQFAPGFEIEREDRRVLARRDGQPVLSMTFSHAGSITSVSGGDVPGAGGWVSDSFGDRTPAPRLCWSGTIPAEGLRTTLDWA